MTISLFLLQKETPAGIEMMQKLEGNRLAEFQKGKIIDRPHFRVMTDVQGCLLSTKPRKAFQKSMRLAGFLKLIPTTAQFAQIQTGGKPFDPNDAANMKLFVEGKFKIAPTKAGSSN